MIDSIKTSRQFLLVHPEMGIYLGSCLGLGFWSKLDPVGQNSAVTFESEETIREVIATWDQSIDGWCAVPVEPDDGHFASIDACVRAGLEEWDPNLMDGKVD